MRVSQINTADVQGGAGRAAYRLHSGLREIGIESHMVCAHQRLGEEEIVRVVPEALRRSSTQAHLVELYDYYVQRELLNENRSRLSDTIFSFPGRGVDLAEMALIARSDLVHLHWINGFLSTESIRRLGADGRPLVWTFHDMWPMTGGCHYSAGCEKYVEDCANCPQLRSDFLGIPAAVLRDKHALWKDLNLTIVTPSHWMADCARQSALFWDTRIEVIQNSVETEVFTPLDKAECRKKFGLDPDAVVIGFGAQTLKDRRKGLPVLLEALKKVAAAAETSGAQGHNRLALIVFGRPTFDLESIDLDTVSAGEVHDSGKLAEIFNASDMIVLPSREDNYPNVMVEAMSCGVPVVGFDTGGMVDGIGDNERGLLVNPVGDPDALADAILELSRDSERAADMGRAARDWIAATHGLQPQAEQMASLYEELVKEPAKESSPAVEQSRRDTRRQPFVARMITDLGPGFDNPKITAPLAQTLEKIRDYGRYPQRPSPLETGRMVNFRSEYSSKYLGDGWNRPSHNGVWSASSSATLFFQTESTPPETITISGFRYGTRAQRVIVTWDDVFIGELKPATQVGSFKLSLPETLVREGAHKLTFQFPDAAHSWDNGVHRVHAFKLASIQLHEAKNAARDVWCATPRSDARLPARYELGQTIEFLGDEGREYLRGKWGDTARRPDLRGNQTGQIVFRTEKPGEPIRVRMTVAVMNGEGINSTLQFGADGVDTGRAPGQLQGPTTVSFMLPADKASRTRSVSLRLLTRDKPRQPITVWLLDFEAEAVSGSEAEATSFEIAPHKHQASDGIELDLRQKGLADPYLGDGWSYPSASWEFRWTDGRSASLYLPAVARQEAYALVLDASGVQVTSRGLPVTVEMNDTPVWTGFVRDFGELNIRVPGELLSEDAPQRVVLRMPHAQNAQPPDKRILGMQVRAIRLEPWRDDMREAPAFRTLGPRSYALGDRVTFDFKSHGPGYLYEGWSAPKREGVETTAASSEIIFRAAQTKGPVRLFLEGDNLDNIEGILFNGGDVSSHMKMKDGALSVSIPQDLFNSDDRKVIRINTSAGERVGLVSLSIAPSKNKWRSPLDFFN